MFGYREVVHDVKTASAPRLLNFQWIVFAHRTNSTALPIHFMIELGQFAQVWLRKLQSGPG
jgi:hypothetical protein